MAFPRTAIFLQLLIVNLLLLTRSFELSSVYTQFSLLLCSLFAVLGRDRACASLVPNCRGRTGFGLIRFRRLSSQ